MASTSEEVPEEISERILRRILLFAGVPTFTGFVSLPLFWYLKVRTAALKPSCMAESICCHHGTWNRRYMLLGYAASLDRVEM